MRWWEELFREEMTGYGQMMSRAPQPFGRRPALLVIDVVRAFTGTRGQTLAESAAEFPTSCGPAAWESMPHLAETIEAARRAGAPVVYTTGMPGSAEPFGGTVKGELGGMNSPMDRPHALDIPDEIAPKPGELVLQKPKASAFFLTALPAYFHRQQVDTLIVTGTTTCGCVRATVVDGFSYGYPTFLVEEACFDRSRLSHGVSLFEMNAKYADVLSVEEIVGRLERVEATSGP